LAVRAQFVFFVELLGEGEGGLEVCQNGLGMLSCLQIWIQRILLMVGCLGTATGGVSGFFVLIKMECRPPSRKS
jgi:hypothetical protein